MLSTKHLVADIREVPETWIFEYYAGLDEQLQGDEVKINSLFNPEDRRPSMCIFLSRKYSKYWFHDFSTGKTGDAIKLVQEIFQCSYGAACDRIRADYKRFRATQSYVPSTRKGSKKYQVTDHKKRSWNVLDAGFWTAFNIDSTALGIYYVMPLEQYTMTNAHDQQDQFVVSGEYIYGYFTPAGLLYKIYRPKRSDCKFIKVSDYLQGIDQLQDRKCLLLMASLKDGLSLLSLLMTVDFVASDSENALLPEATVRQLLKRYHGNVFTLLDNDEAGIKAMQEYRRRYGLLPILLPLSKDVSDSVRDLNPVRVLHQVVPLIDRQLNRTAGVKNTG